MKRSVLTEGQGLPVHLVAAGANRHDSPLLTPSLAGLDKVAALTTTEPVAVQLDRGYDNDPTRVRLPELELDGIIPQRRPGAPSRRGAAGKWNGPMPG